MIGGTRWTLRIPCSFLWVIVGWTDIPSIKIFIMRLEKLIRLCDKRRRVYEKILDDTTECCICAELCACGWNDWRVHFAATGVLYYHRWDDEHSLSVQARMAAQESFALTFEEMDRQRVHLFLYTEIVQKKQKFFCASVKRQNFTQRIAVIIVLCYNEQRRRMNCAQ